MTPVSGRNDAVQKERNVNRGIHSEFIEHSQQSLGALNIEKSRVQATDQMNTRHIPLTGYENFQKEMQTYPVSRDPMTVQLTGVDNVSWIYQTLIQTCLHLCFQIQAPITIIIITKYIRRK